MSGTLQPLDQKFAIVDEHGNPTEYFIRWAQQRQIDITGSLTLGDLEAYLTAHMLREGQGIALTPNGDLNNAPSIAIRNGIGLDFDAMHNIKLADTAVILGTYGDATHVPKITVDQQGRITGVVLVAISGGGGASVPSLASTGYATWLNQGAATVADTIYGINIGSPSEASNHRIRGRYKAVPATPYRIMAEFEWGVTGANASGITFGWRDSVSGKLSTILVQWSSGIYRADWSDPNTGAAFTSFGSSPQARFCLQLRDDGTNISIGYSHNMADFNIMYSVAKAAGYLGATGYNQLIFGTDNFNGAGSCVISNYIETP